LNFDAENDDLINDQDTEDKVRLWLEKSDTQSNIEKIARTVAKKVISKKISLKFAGINDPEVIDDKLIHTIISIISIFLLENRRNIQKKLIVSPDQKARILQNSFINYCRDKTRSPSSNIFKYTYKRTADILREADQFYTIAESKGSKLKSSTAFSMHKAGLKKGLSCSPMNSDIFLQIPFPEKVSSTTYDEINKAKTIKVLAEYFWKQTSGIYGRPVTIDIRDFVFWLNIHVVFPNINNEDFVDIMEMEKTKGLELINDPEPEEFDSDLITQWASNFAATLSDKDKSIFFLRHHDQLGYKEIAEKTGYKGASGAQMRIKVIEEQLRSFLRPLPWLSPGDRNLAKPIKSPQSGETTALIEDAFKVFGKALINNLKKSIKKP